MRTYWLRILLGALAVFAVGMIGIHFARRTRDTVTAVVTGSGPLSIPLPFVPFELEGNKLGRLERLVVNREAPKKVSSVDLEVKLDDSLLVQGLAGCRLAANLESDSSKSGDINFRSHRLEDQAFFFCAKSDSGLVEFGTVRLTPGNVTVPLLVARVGGSAKKARYARLWPSRRKSFRRSRSTLSSGTNLILASGPDGSAAVRRWRIVIPAR